MLSKFMKIPETVILQFNNKTYKINKDVLEKYRQMHPIRTEDSLAHDISKFLINENIEVTTKKIEEMIMEEYDAVSKMNFPDMIEEARQKYENSIQHGISD